MSSPDVSQLLPPAPINTPVAGQNGLVNQQWTMYFQKLNARVGGGSSDNLSTVISNLATAQGQITTLQGQLTTLQGTVAGQAALIAALQGTTARQASQISALQLILSAGIPAAITTAALTTGGAEGSMTFNGGVLTAEIPAS